MNSIYESKTFTEFHYLYHRVSEALTQSKLLRYSSS